MRCTLARVAIAAGILVASSAQAGPLVQATFILSVGTLPPPTFSASGGLLGAAHGSGAGANWWIGAGEVPGGTTTLSVPTSAAPPIDDIIFIVNGNPAVGSFAGSATGQMAVTGLVNVTAYSGLILLGIPIVLGTPSVIISPAVSGVGITGYANAWTTKTTSVYATAIGDTVTVMGANGLVNGGGTLVLVSALNVVTSIAGQLPSFAILSLTYLPDAVPEPGTVLLAACIAGLTAIGSRKLQRKRGPEPPPL